MLDIRGLYKERKKDTINDLTLKLQHGEIASLECSNEISDMLFSLILGKEIPAKGEILLSGKRNTEYLRDNMGSIGVVRRNEGFYERMTVMEYMRLFSTLVDSKVRYQEVLLKLALLDLAGARIKDLDYSQRKRLSFAREILKSPVLLLFQEPIINLNKDDVRVVMENIEALCAQGTAVFCTSISFKETLLLGGHSYYVDSNGMTELYPDKTEVAASRDNEDQPKPSYTISKIPAKLEDRILLFDPEEIDYIESGEGVSHLHIRGERFVSTLSLNELEERLKYFGFFRSHRSYLVNLQKVREVVTWTRNSYSLSLDDKNKSTIPLSKGRLDDLKNILSL